MMEGGKNASRRYKMITYQEFKENPRNLIKYAISLYKEHEQYILPAVSIGATVTGFRSLEDLKKEQGYNLKNFFNKPVSKEEHSRRQKSI